MNSSIKKLAFAGIFTALAVVCSAFYIPIGVSKCFPIQHMVNVLAGVFLGPWYSCGMAFVTSLIRVLMGTGSILAFPGSMIGALLCGLVYRKTKMLIPTVIGEVFGTGILGALAAYPLATFFLSQEAAVFGFVIPFGVSSFGDALISLVILLVLQRTRALDQLQKSLSSR